MASRSPKRTLFLTLCLALAAARGLTQSSDPVHIEPQTSPNPNSPPDVIATHQRPFVSNVDLVIVPVTVTDPVNRFVTGLEREHFSVSEDKVPQTIEYFYTQDTPISVGLIFDVSRSMSRAVDYSRIALEEFMRTANPQDEFFLISFARKPQILKNFTQKDDEIASQLLTVKVGALLRY